MKRILFIYHDPIFLDFINNYLAYKDYEVFPAMNGLEGIRICTKEYINLIIAEKEISGIELEGFFIKKDLNPRIKDLPVFLVGDFSPEEIKKFGNNNVKAFISVPINANALLERLNLFFKKVVHTENKVTPMLVDMHSKGKILIVQIEGNFEPDKLEILNYEIRFYCKKKKIKSPKIFFIIPSLYPESITPENLNLLFKFMNYPELHITPKHIRLLSQCLPLLKEIENHEIFSDIEVVSSFIEGIQKLNLDIDNRKVIYIEHLKEGASFIFDLYDEDGMVRIPAMTKLTADMINYLKKSGEKKFTYYSETNIEDANSEEEEAVFSNESKDNYESILTDFEVIPEEDRILANNNDDKMKLFFSKLKDKNMLVVSYNKKNNDIIFNALKTYVDINFINSGSEIPELKDGDYISVFIDMDVKNPDPFEILKKIRSQVTRRQTSVIITAKHINRMELNMLKNNGTDNILLYPFSTDKILRKVFESVSSDRKN